MTRIILNITEQKVLVKDGSELMTSLELKVLFILIYPLLYEMCRMINL